MKNEPTNHDGETHWPNYRPQFEATAEYNHWDNEAKATAIILALRGIVLVILPNIHKNKQKYY